MKFLASLTLAAATLAVSVPASAQFAKPETPSNTARVHCL